MKARHNEATLNRPEGDRILDAPFVFIDIEKFSDQLKNEEAWKKNDRNGITVYKTDGFTMVLTWLHRDAVIMDNLVGGLISLHVLNGKIDFTVENGTTQLTKNQIITIHTGIMHTIHAREDSLLLITTRDEHQS